MEPKDYYTVVIHYQDGTNIGIEKFTNLTISQVKECKNTLYIRGFKVIIDNNKYELISPLKIHQVFVDKQDQFIK